MTVHIYMAIIVTIFFYTNFAWFDVYEFLYKPFFFFSIISTYASSLMHGRWTLCVMYGEWGRVATKPECLLISIKYLYSGAFQYFLWRVNTLRVCVINISQVWLIFIQFMFFSLLKNLTWLAGFVIIHIINY